MGQKYNNSYMSSIARVYNEKPNFSNEEDLMMEPFNYLRRKPYKLTKRFIDAMNYWYKLSEDKLKLAHEIIEYSAENFNLIDDIVDGTKLARGEPSTHIVYGVPRTLMCAEFIGFKVIEKLAALNNPEVFKWYAEMGINVESGQTLEILYRDSPCPSLDEYLHIGSGKSSSFFLFFSRLMQSLSQNKTDHSGAVSLFGYFILMHNDYLNLFIPENESKYSAFADDLCEGKYTYPLVHAIRTLGNQEVADIVKQKPTDLETRRRCVKILREIGTQEFCLDVLKELAEKIKLEMAQTEENPLIVQFLDEAFESIAQIWV